MLPPTMSRSPDVPWQQSARAGGEPAAAGRGAHARPTMLPEPNVGRVTTYLIRALPRDRAVAIEFGAAPGPG
jgi:hypothetical protein